MAYELFAGHRPFYSAEPGQPPPGAEAARPVGISDQAWHLLSVCLAEERQRRPNAAQLLRMVKALPEATGYGGRPPVDRGLAGDVYADGDGGDVYDGDDGETHDPSQESTLDDDWTGDGLQRRRQPPRHGRPKPDAGGAVAPAVPGARRGARPANRSTWVSVAPVPLFLLVFGLVFVLVRTVLPSTGTGTGPGPGPSTSATETAAASSGYVELAFEAVSRESNIVTLSWPRETWVRPGSQLIVDSDRTEHPVDAPANGTIDEQTSNARGKYCYTVKIFVVEDVTSIPRTGNPVCLAADGANVVQTNYP
jgi:hypothetical protein